MWDSYKQNVPESFYSSGTLIDFFNIKIAIGMF